MSCLFWFCKDNVLNIDIMHLVSLIPIYFKISPYLLSKNNIDSGLYALLFHGQLHRIIRCKYKHIIPDFFVLNFKLYVDNGI